jgi:hypothetical protein
MESLLIYPSKLIIIFLLLIIFKKQIIHNNLIVLVKKIKSKNYIYIAIINSINSNLCNIDILTSIKSFKIVPYLTKNKSNSFLDFDYLDDQINIKTELYPYKIKINSSIDRDDDDNNNWNQFADVGYFY